MNAGKVLIGFALLWIIAWCIVGFAIGTSSDGYHQKMTELAQSGDLAQFWATFSAWKAHAVAHAHGLCLSIVAFLVGLAMAAKVIVVRVNLLTLFFIAGIALASVADWFGIVPMIIAGDILFIAALVIAFIGLFVRPTKADV